VVPPVVGEADEPGEVGEVVMLLGALLPRSRPPAYIARGRRAWYGREVPLTPGSTFERYEIQSLIGRGGMGEVYRAIDTRLHRPVALKVLRTDKDASATVTEAGGVARLLREARAAAALNHANSVAIYELGEAEGIAYIAMELVIGVTLRRYVGDAGNVALETKVSWLVDAARALWAAHKAGLVHRDVKPGNIMVSEEGVVKVLDFGLAKPVALRAGPTEFQTQMVQVLGTPRYMSPEQLEGSPADASADQYAFGLTAYELVSGVYPGGPLAAMPAPLHERSPGISPELGRAVARMMARSPKDRFPTMESAAHALRGCFAAQPQRPAPKKLDRTLDDDEFAAAKATRPSDAPTAIVDVVVEMAEPVSAERAILAKGATLPLGVPLQVAIGHHAAAQLRNHALATVPSHPPASFNRTMPLQRPSTRGSDPSVRVTPPPSNPALQAAPSGVYSARSQAHADSLRSTGGTRPGYPGSSRSAKPNFWILLLVLGVTAMTASIVAAWLLH
jgi:serine/threonine protein kinase